MVESVFSISVMNSAVSASSELSSKRSTSLVEDIDKEGEADDDDDEEEEEEEEEEREGERDGEEEEDAK